MGKNKIKISDIQNLTDARYFAAMGVDYLGFCCNPNSEVYCSTQRIKEIVEWVEGPQAVLQFEGFQNENDIKEVLASGLGDAVHFGVFATYDNTFGVPSFKEWIFDNVSDEEYLKFDFPILRSDTSYSALSTIQQERLDYLLNLKYGYIDLRWETHELSEMIQNLPPCGLILRGGQEERVGVKSFENLDDIFEILQD
jgi:phosphoribosylanthranilate isomerase